MRLLFMVKHPGTLRLLGSSIRGLSERGHEIHLAFDSVKTAESVRAAEELVAELPGVTFGKGPSARDEWSDFAERVRLGIDYLRYLEPPYADAPKLRGRAEAQAPRSVQRLTRAPRIARHAARWVLEHIERSLEPPSKVASFIKKQAPDIVFVTPLVGLGSRQADYVRAAQRLGIKTAFPVLSWDNLTNKGLLRDVPDLVLLWNERQAAEATELHGIPRSHIAVTGASGFDHWFAWQPSRTRKEFCEEIGIRHDRPFILYACSSPFIAPAEAHAVAAWVEQIRRREDLVDVGIVVRPHPQNAAQWRAQPLSARQVAVWPQTGEEPLEDQARRNYYDSIFHSSAVVGVNTSALIESGIVGRPVLTLLSDEFRGVQEGTLHFRYLAEGLLRVASSFDEHAEHIREAIEDGGDAVGANAFIESFVRPHGIEKPATPFFVEAIEQLGDQPAPGRRTASIGRPLVSLALRRPARRAREAARATKKARSRPPATESIAATSDVYKSTRQALKEITRGSGPILAGPWVSEVGYELLYWIPFLRFAASRDLSLGERLVVVSRGGTSSWYADVAQGGYIDLYDHLAPGELLEEYGRREAAGEARKQMTRHPFDDDLLARVAATRGLEGASVLHPSVMYSAYWALLKQEAIHRKRTVFEYAPLPEPPIEAEVAARLPDNFVAVRFYFNASFPATQENREIATMLIEDIARSTPVVLLDPSTRYDDHSDLELSEIEGVTRIDDLMTPEKNLEIQTSVIARARAVVGTYGGLSYLGPFLGVPAVAVYSNAQRFRPHHLEIAQRLFRADAYGSFAAFDVRQLALLRIALGNRIASPG